VRLGERQRGRCATRGEAEKGREREEDVGTRGKDSNTVWLPLYCIRVLS
jgi:hypothetical protein